MANSSDSRIPESSRRVDATRRDDAFDVLEQCAVALETAESSQDQIRKLMEGVRRAVAPDALIWHCGRGGESIVVGNEDSLSPVRSAALVEELLRGNPGAEKHILRTSLPPRGSGPAPRSVAMVRISRSNACWLAAINFDPGRPLQVADLKVMRLARRLLLIRRQHRKMQEKLYSTVQGLIRCVIAAVEAKDPFSRGHSERVGRAAVRLGNQLKLPSPTLSDLYVAGLLHDIGKIEIHADVFRTPGRLNADDTEQIRSHSQIGDRLLAHLPALAHLRPIIRHHHEHWDGSGYPDGLAGESIPLPARVLAVADACEAMLAERGYRHARPCAEIEAIVESGAGQQWDPDIVKHFLDCRDDIFAICQAPAADGSLSCRNGTPSGEPSSTAAR